MTITAKEQCLPCLGILHERNTSLNLTQNVLRQSFRTNTNYVNTTCQFTKPRWYLENLSDPMKYVMFRKYVMLRNNWSSPLKPNCLGDCLRPGIILSINETQLINLILNDEFMKVQGWFVAIFGNKPTNE